MNCPIFPDRDELLTRILERCVVTDNPWCDRSIIKYRWCYVKTDKMGLCKCPKRKVTNLFCFEHKVNVCENCLVTDHVRCIIKYVFSIWYCPMVKKTGLVRPTMRSKSFLYWHHGCVWSVRKCLRVLEWRCKDATKTEYLHVWVERLKSCYRKKTYKRITYICTQLFNGLR